MSDPVEVVVLGLAPPEQETVQEVVFYWPEHRATGQFAECARGFDVILSAGDTCQESGGTYALNFCERPTTKKGQAPVPARHVVVPPGYTWVETRTYTREKKAVRPDVPTRES